MQSHYDVVVIGAGPAGEGAAMKLTQEVLAQFIRDGGYDHHLRRLRAALKTQMHQMVDAVARHFPMGCRMILPQGGMMLWIEMPRHVDSREVFALALHRHQAAHRVGEVGQQHHGEHPGH